MAWHELGVEVGPHCREFGLRAPRLRDGIGWDGRRYFVNRSLKEGEWELVISALLLVLFAE